VIFDPVGIEASTQTLLQKGRPFILRPLLFKWNEFCADILS
jgi:hypothetical protein